MTKHRARKRFGQHFLTDPGVIDAIIRAVHPTGDDVVVEIGPGQGAITDALARNAGHLHAVELDRDLAARLRRQYGDHPNVTVHEGDALQFDFAALGEKLRIVGNLPYNISSPLLFHFAAYAERIKDMHFMLQNEVVERMVAEPSTPEYGRLSVMLQYRFFMEKLLDVPPESFRPAPKVDSAIVRMIPLPASEIVVRNEKLFAAVVRTAFGQRRKTLRNTLRGYLSDLDYKKLGVDAQLRAENLAVADFIRVANYLEGRE